MSSTNDVPFAGPKRKRNTVSAELRVLGGLVAIQNSVSEEIDVKKAVGKSRGVAKGASTGW